MISRERFTRWYRHRYLGAAAILLTVSAGAVVLVGSAGPQADPVELPGALMTRMRTTLEQTNPEQHQHTGQTVQQAAGQEATSTVICGVRVYGYEPAEVTALADVRTVYGFHLCGVAEDKRPWDVAVKLAGPVVLDMSTEPPGIRVVEATADVTYVDRLRQMFPHRYAELALKEALAVGEMSDLRRRYDAAAGL